MTAARHAAPDVDGTITDKSGSRASRYPMLFAIGAIFVALGVVVVEILVLRPQLRTPDSVVKYWTFDVQAADVNPLLDFQVIDHGRSTAALAVGPEGLTHGAGLTGNSASYIQKALPGPVNRIGVTATFPTVGADATGGAVVLLVPSRALPTDPQLLDSDPPDMGIHFVFDAHAWVMGLWRQDSEQQILSSGTFEPALAGDRSVEIVRQSDEVTIFLPDGLTRTFRNPNIASWSGNWVAWELYEKKAGTTPAVIHRVWVGWTP
jgi:hypothetical protein